MHVWKISYRDGDAVKTDLVLASDIKEAVDEFNRAKSQLLQIGINGELMKIILKVELIETLPEDSEE